MSTLSQPKSGARVRRRSIGPLPYVFIAPALLYLAVFMALPLLKGFQLSLTDARILQPQGGDFVGLRNYIDVVTSSQFFRSLWATFVYCAGTVVFSLTLGTLAAILINRSFRGRWLSRAILTFPWAAPTVAVALIFAWIYNLQSGVLNRAMAALGLDERGWLLEPSLGMFSVLLTTVWKVTPFVMLVVLAALQSIAEELYEAGRVDGADALSMFRAVTLPHLAPTLRVVALLMTIWSIRRFEIIYLLTGGGPAERTNTIVVNVYQTAFSDGRLGRAAAIGMLGMAISTVVTLIYYSVERKQDVGAAK